MYFFDIEKHKFENFNLSDYKVFDLRYNLDKNLKNIIPFIYFDEEKTQYSAVVLRLKSEYISKKNKLLFKLICPLLQNKNIFVCHLTYPQNYSYDDIVRRDEYAHYSYSFITYGKDLILIHADMIEDHFYMDSFTDYCFIEGKEKHDRRIFREYLRYNELMKKYHDFIFNTLKINLCIINKYDFYKIYNKEAKCDYIKYHI